MEFDVLRTKVGFVYSCCGFCVILIDRERDSKVNVMSVYGFAGTVFRDWFGLSFDESAPRTKFISRPRTSLGSRQAITCRRDCSCDCSCRDELSR